MSNDWDIIITNKNRLFSLDLSEVWRYRDLLTMYVKRDIITFYKQTILGPLWFVIQPLFTTIMFMFVFGGIAGISTDGIPQAVFYLAGLVCWNYFQDCLSKCSDTFNANQAIFGKVYFPRLTTPISNMLTSGIEFGIQMLIVLAFLIYYLICGAVQPHWLDWLLIPLVLLHLGVMGLGFGIIISSLTTKYRDLSILVTFGVQLWMYVTPVVYPLSQAKEGLFRTALLINPVTAPVEVFRYALLGQGTIVPWALAWSWALTVFTAVFGIMIFNRVEKTFMDTV